MKISELPQEIKEKALAYQRNGIATYYDKSTDNLLEAFDWESTEEKTSFWRDLHISLSNNKQEISKTKEPKHYDNSKGSLYQFCEQQGLNSYEFDIIKRIIRCRKKGNFLEDLEKTKFLIDLYIKEHKEVKPTNGILQNFPHRES
jgi:hypothetical protein